MYYEIIDNKTDKVIARENSWEEAARMGEWHFDGDQSAFWVRQVIPCRGCGTSEANEKHDAHGIPTGYWCEPCYDSSKYPYRKDRYLTEETHGFGERLSDDY